MKIRSLIAAIFLLCSFASFAQAPVNDLCANAVSVTVAPTCSPTSGTLYNATTLAITGGCINNKDVWYKFQVPAGSSSVSIKATITSTTTTLTNANTSIELFNASACPGINLSLGCGTLAAAKFYGGLVAGSTYMFRIATTVSTTTGASNSYDFNVCVTSNDDPSGTMTLPQGVLVDGNLIGAGATAGIPLGSCTGTPDDDLFYKFVATGSTGTINVTSIGSDLATSGVRTQLFSGPVGALTSIGCGTTRLDATSLIPGDTYYCRIYSAGAGQTGTAWAYKIAYIAPVNDDPLNAVPVLRGGALVDGNLMGASATAGIPVGCATGDPDDDIYYKFVATASNAVLQLSTVGGDVTASGARMQIFSGAIGSFTSIGCGTTVVQVTGLTLGDTYYCRVYSAGTGQTGNAWSFKIAWIVNAIDDAPNAALITAGGTYGGSLLYAGATTGSPVACASGNPDDDVYIRFVATTSYATFQITTSADLTASGVRMQVYSGPVGSFTSVACGTTRVEATGLIPGDTYYCRVYSAGTGQTGTLWNFTLKWTVNATDDPAAATTINQNIQLSGNLLAAGVTTGVPTACAGGNPDDDVYFKFVPATTYASFSITNLGTDLTASGVRTQIFSGAIGSFTSVSCGNNRIESTALIPGNTYYCRVYSAGTGQTGTGWNFKILWLPEPANDDPLNAVFVAAGSTVSGDLLAAGATTGIPLGCAPSLADDDVYFKFTPVYSYATITVSGAAADLAASGIKTQVFSGAIGSFTSVACGGSTVNATGLTPGNTYYCRVSSAATTQTGLLYGFKLSVHPSALTTVTAGRMKEVYSQQILSAPNILADPWEITYGPDNNLWVTESKGYKVYKINPNTGTRDTILDISQFSTTSPDNTFNCQFNNGSGAQGGLAGLALHPKFLAAVGAKNYVYLAYVYSQTSSNIFVNRVVRFTYNTATNKLESPVSVCDTLPGSSDHNSQRMIIAPVGGVDYLFYAQGDMGAGQFANAMRPQNAQNIFSYEGKILRFNLEPDGDGGARDEWIPSTGSGNGTNPYSSLVGKQHAVWAMGIRNNQGFVYDPILDKLYGSSHGPFSDDEINVIERGKNYGHPIVIGYADGNANGTTAGASPGMSPAYPSTCPDIVDEVATAAALPNYKDPLFSAYPNSLNFPTLKGLWDQMPVSNNGLWPSEGWSGLDMYTNTVIPGWKRSLIASSLKWGRLLRLKLDATGTKTAPTNTAADTISYFGSINRFRDLAFAPNGKDIYVIMDRSTSTSGPSAAFPVVPACPGCLQKYTFIGYNDFSGQSSIPTSIDVTDGALNSCNTGTTVTIDNTNSNYWVPITGPDGNIMAEIYSNGQNLGTITSSFYKNGGPVRSKYGASYADRNITITPQNQPASPVKVRLYLSKTEYDAFDADPLSGISTIADIRIHKNNDPCQSTLVAATSMIDPTFAGTHGADGYAFQADISGFSTFYFASTSVTLPLSTLKFSGRYAEMVSYLKWETNNELQTSYFEVERSITNGIYEKIGKVQAVGNANEKSNYTFNDQEAGKLGAPRIFYRLKIIHADGSYAYSTVVVIEMPGSFITRITIFPNPAEKITTVLISSPAEQQVKLELVDVAGRKVMTKNALLKKGENRIQIDLGSLRAGVYFLRIKGQFVNAQEKIQKL
jgi:trimeric autotransporter adhesin